MGHVLAANSEEEHGWNSNAQVKKNTRLRNGANGARDGSVDKDAYPTEHRSGSSHTSGTPAPRDTTSSSRLLSVSNTHNFFFKNQKSRHFQPKAEAIQGKI